MTIRLSLGAHLAPIGAYIVLVSAIAIIRKFLSPGFVLPLAAVLMFGVPFIMKGDVRGLNWNLRGVLLGLLISFVILSLYVALYLVFTDKPLKLGKISPSLIVLHLFLVAIPEEVFFRGYLQEEVGNNVKGVLVVSLLFAIGHLVSRCLVGGCSSMGYAENFLTFFPSIVMGYMYVISGTLWANIIFHFLANVVYIAMGGL